MFDYLKATLEIILALVIAISPFYALKFASARKKADGTPMGFGVRLIQFLTVTMGLPAILLLALGGIITESVTGTLLGGLFGYVLSNISDYKPNRPKSQKSKTGEKQKSDETEDGDEEDITD